MAIKTAGLFLLLFLFAAAASAQTNQGWPACRHPIRIFANQTAVNLTPLFEWWQRQPLAGPAATNQDLADDPRPLAAWHRITGAKLGELGNSWVMSAVIYSSPTTHTNARIILNHPPAEEQLFYTLKAQLAETARQITNAQHAYQADTKAAQKDEEEAWNYLRSGAKRATESYNNFMRLARQKRAAAAAALNQENQLEAARPLIQKQLNAIPSVNGKYQFDWFALTLGRSKQGVLIYDLGVVPPDPP